MGEMGPGPSGRSGEGFEEGRAGVGSTMLEQLEVFQCSPGGSASSKVLKKTFVTLSGPNKLGLRRGINVKTDKQKHRAAHPSFSSLCFCLLAYTAQLSCKCKATGMHWLHLCNSCLHHENKQK